LTKDRTGRF